MNHDATHCLDYKKSCPKSYYRVQVTEDLKKTFHPLPVSFAHFNGTKECPIRKGIQSNA